MNARLAIVLTTGLLVAGFFNSFVHGRYVQRAKPKAVHAYSQITDSAARCREGCITNVSIGKK